MSVLVKAVVFLSCAMGLYVFVLYAQTRAAAQLCAAHPVGSRIESLDDLPGTFYLTPMGPTSDASRPAAQTAIFCASTTMCDTSCRLTTEKGVVVAADFRDF